MTETKQITQYKIYYISLADVRGGVDKARPLFAFDDLEKLLAWEKNQMGAWTDGPSPDSYGNSHPYQKAYKKGSPLEWFNPPHSLEPSEYPDCFGGIGYVWVTDMYNLSIPLNPQ